MSFLLPGGSLTPSAQIIRWQGTSGANGFRLKAPPTARGEEFIALDNEAYEDTFPRGICMSNAYTRCLRLASGRKGVEVSLSRQTSWYSVTAILFITFKFLGCYDVGCFARQTVIYS